jgi:hypothetical protein
MAINRSLVPASTTVQLQVATGLAYRLKVRPPQGHCLWCGDKADLGHDEFCLVRPTIGRHDAVVWVLANTCLLITRPQCTLSLTPMRGGGGITSGGTALPTMGAEP